MPFGGFCPMPIRLDAEDWTPAQQSRQASDASHKLRTAKFALLTYTVDSVAGTVVVHSYEALHGRGVSVAPTAAINGAGDVTFTWPSSYADDYGNAFETHVRGATLTRHGATPCQTIVVCTSTTVRAIGTLSGVGGKNGTYTLTVSGGIRRPMALYGGSVDKAIATSERIPHAYSFYVELMNMRGSAYRKDATGLVHAENIALARSEAARFRCPERRVANSLPRTADECLARWVEVLKVPVSGDDTDEDIRIRCAARYVAAVGPTDDAQDAAIARLLGDAFVRTWRQKGVDLDTPPTQTFWPSEHTGPIAYSMRGALTGVPLTWLSERSHLVVEVTRPARLTSSEFLQLMNVHLFRLLDDMLPAAMTFNWAINVATGFVLDVAELDFTGFNP